jgi:hypothetical protein
MGREKHQRWPEPFSPAPDQVIQRRANGTVLLGRALSQKSLYLLQIITNQTNKG